MASRPLTFYEWFEGNKDDFWDAEEGGYNEDELQTAYVNYREEWEDGYADYLYSMKKEEGL